MHAHTHAYMIVTNAIVTARVMRAVITAPAYGM